MTTNTDGLSVHTLRQMLAEAENDAGLALARSTKALIAWGEAEERGNEKDIDTARETFDRALVARLQADAKRDYLRGELRRVTGRAA